MTFKLGDKVTWMRWTDNDSGYHFTAKLVGWRGIDICTLAAIEINPTCHAFTIERTHDIGRWKYDEKGREWPEGIFPVCIVPFSELLHYTEPKNKPFLETSLSPEIESTLKHILMEDIVSKTIKNTLCHGVFWTKEGNMQTAENRNVYILHDRASHQIVVCSLAQLQQSITDLKSTACELLTRQTANMEFCVCYDKQTNGIHIASPKTSIDPKTTDLPWHYWKADCFDNWSEDLPNVELTKLAIKHRPLNA